MVLVRATKVGFGLDEICSAKSDNQALKGQVSGSTDFFCYFEQLLVIILFEVVVFCRKGKFPHFLRLAKC
jgi:hypothetical protein